MRRMSFALTTAAVLARTKTITRRTGWLFAKVGDRYLAVDKLRTKDAKKLGVIEVVSVRRERLWKIYAQSFDACDVPTSQPFGYSANEVRREGFEAMDAVDFADLFMRACGMDHDDFDVTRIEFRYVDEQEIA